MSVTAKNTLLARGEDPASAHVSRGSWTFRFGAGSAVLALGSGIATSLILTGLTSIRPTDGVVVAVILINILFVLPLLGAIGWQILNMWRARQRRVAGSRLHIRMVGLFSVIALLPAILLAAFAAMSLNRALDQVFSARVKGIVSNSLNVARAYVDEHANILRGDLVAMARDIDASAEMFRTEPDKFKALFATQAGLRDLSFAYLIDPAGRAKLTSDKAEKTAYLTPPSAALADAAAGQAVVIAPGRSNRVGGIQKLANLPDTYLYVLRPVDGQVLEHLRRTEEGVQQYSGLNQLQRGIKIASGIMYVVIALTLLLTAIWLGLWFASRLIAPIRRLIAAAELVSNGELGVQVPVLRGESDLKKLSQTFNKMTGDLKTQRDELISTNAQLNERRRFTEAVLSGVTAGVLGLDADGRINLANPSAEALLGKARDELIGQRLSDAVPEFAKLVAPEALGPRADLPEPITMTIDGSERTFAARVTREQASDEARGSVVTFDDISELVTAQRTSAWADIARRIAHEIKNPLTPIQLSAERLKRKYSNAITEDREIFDKCVNTIVRQVGDIGRMVDEFSSFARMPKPQMEKLDLSRVVRESAALYELGSQGVDIKIETPAEPVMALCDRRLINQALTNLIKNATEAIGAVSESGQAPAGFRGIITVKLKPHGEMADIEVIDNGVGLPRQNRTRLTEPYVTTRAKGTGLGLAIVQKITEQHGGAIMLEDAPAAADGTQRGALVRMRVSRGALDTTHSPAMADTTDAAARPVPANMAKVH